MAIETYPAIPVSRALNGLGINLGSLYAAEWAYAEAKDAGCKEIRFGAVWSSSEVYASPGTFNLDYLTEPLRLCKKYGLRPLLGAWYAPPWETLRTVTINGTHPVGSMAVTVTGNVADLIIGRDHIGGLWYESGFGKASYYGSVIHSVAGQVLNLGSATTEELPNGKVVSINRLLYASVNAVSGSASAERFADYVQALAVKMNQAGISEGRIEIWNEPPWNNDKWDNRSASYDDPAGMGIPTWTYTVQPLNNALKTRSFPPGIGLVNGGTNKSGAHGILRYMSAAEVQASAYVADAIHSYGSPAEVHAWASFGTGLDWGGDYKNIIGSGNFAYNSKVHTDNPTAGLETVITECSAFTTDQTLKRKFDLRHLICMWAMDIPMVNIYSLGDSVGFQMVDPATQIPNPPWVDIKRLMNVVGLISRRESDYELPVISSWAGVINLAVFTIGPLMVVYQRNENNDRTRRDKLVIAAGSGTLLSWGGNGERHLPRRGNSIYVAETPVLLTRRL